MLPEIEPQNDGSHAIHHPGCYAGDVMVEVCLSLISLLRPL
jgi:hypothetical protein